MEFKDKVRRLCKTVRGQGIPCRATAGPSGCSLVHVPQGVFCVDPAARKVTYEGEPGAPMLEQALLALCPPPVFTFAGPMTKGDERKFFRFVPRSADAHGSGRKRQQQKHTRPCPVGESLVTGRDTSAARVQLPKQAARYILPKLHTFTPKELARETAHSVA